MTTKAEITPDFNQYAKLVDTGTRKVAGLGIQAQIQAVHVSPHNLNRSLRSMQNLDLYPSISAYAVQLTSAQPPQCVKHAFRYLVDTHRLSRLLPLAKNAASSATAAQLVEATKVSLSASK